MRTEKRMEVKNRKRHIWRAGLAAVLALSLAGCGSGGENGQGEQEPVRISSQTQENATGTEGVADYPGTAELDGTLAAGVNPFAYDLAAQLKEKEGNYFFSPYSIGSALSLLDNAADGETKRQIEEMLGISDLMNWNMQLGCYMDREQPEEAKLTTANSLWFDLTYVPAETTYTEYIPLAEFYYGARLYQADFKNDPEGTKNRINEWVYENTGGMIQDYMEEVDRDVKLSIINAVYFYGEWKIPFEAAYTVDSTFHGADGDTEVPMMRNSGLWLAYYEADGMKGICLPYGNEESKVMNILIPSEDTEQPVWEIFDGWTYEQKELFLNTLMGAQERNVSILQLPKFQMEYTLEELNEVLMQLGMTDAFDITNAQFPGIGEEIYVSSVSHMAKIEVDELGSRAAAVTEIETKDAGAPYWEESVEFIVNQPFLFFIQDSETGMILFMGQAANL